MLFEGEKSLNDGSTGSVRIAPGHHLYPGVDGIWRCSIPGGRFIRIHASDWLLRCLQGVLEGVLPLEDALAAEDGGVTFAELLDAFKERGFLANGPDRDSRTTAGRGVQVEGENPIAWLAADLLQAHVRVIRGPIDRDSVSALDMVISCAEWLPDAHWRQVDRWCAEHAVPWHMCYAEGLQFYVGPCSLPGRTPTYRETRARRLAAAGLPDELLAYWQYLDRDEQLPAVPWPSAGGAALVAGLLVADALSCLAGRVVPSEGYQLRVDPSEPSIDRHPVLPLPERGGEYAQAPSGDMR